MTLFHDNGHLSDEGLQALVAGQLDELQSLEASEHLGYCGACLEHYLGLLENAPLMAPETPLRESVMRRIGRKAKRVLFSRYATVAVAACLVLAMWGTGFTGNLLNSTRSETASGPDTASPSTSQTATPEDPGPSLATRLNRAAWDMPNTMNEFFSFLNPLSKEATKQQDKKEDQTNSEQNPNSSSTQGGNQNT
ncbi:hypothetical protein LJC49_08340 [Ruminococcaceae bacterium OttesenSCG-928-I18]|nr:hypothetical protein [Ruminococcaceae bacterium OttesenSCG-928-I18]